MGNFCNKQEKMTEYQSKRLTQYKAPVQPIKSLPIQSRTSPPLPIQSTASSPLLIQSRAASKVIQTIVNASNKSTEQQFQELCRTKHQFLVHLKAGSEEAFSPETILSFVPYKWINLESLDFQCSNMGPKGCKILTKVNFPQLRSINIGGNCIQDTGVLHLSKMALCPHLEQLNINWNGLIHCSTWIVRISFRNITQLQFRGNNLTKIEVEKIILLPYQLKVLGLSIHQITYNQINLTQRVKIFFIKDSANQASMIDCSIYDQTK